MARKARARQSNQQWTNSPSLLSLERELDARGVFALVRVAALGAGERIPGLHEERIGGSRARVRGDVVLVELGAPEAHGVRGSKDVAAPLGRSASIAEPDFDGHFVGLLVCSMRRGVVVLVLLRWDCCCWNV